MMAGWLISLLVEDGKGNDCELVEVDDRVDVNDWLCKIEGMGLDRTVTLDVEDESLDDDDDVAVVVEDEAEECCYSVDDAPRLFTLIRSLSVQIAPNRFLSHFPCHQRSFSR